MAMSFSTGQLRYFVAVAESGQITRAAAKLHVAQPALSQAISSLESELGLELFERHARGAALTPAGRTFLQKARAVLIADDDAFRTAQSLGREARGAIRFGYIGIPPGLTNPDLIEAFADAHPEVTLRLHGLPFPSTPTASWLEEVDVAIASQPAADQHVWTLPLRAEPRVVLAPESHPLAERSELTVAEVLDETFLGFDPSIDPVWAGFWSLDDHRGGPPADTTAARSANAQERFALIVAGGGIATVPACHAEIIAKALPGVVAIPIRHADPTILSLVGREDRRDRVVEALLAVAGELGAEQRLSASMHGQPVPSSSP
jgi:DNA-binding transcriptional LysR family regulator